MEAALYIKYVFSKHRFFSLELVICVVYTLSVLETYKPLAVLTYL